MTHDRDRVLARRGHAMLVLAILAIAAVTVIAVHRSLWPPRPVHGHVGGPG